MNKNNTKDWTGNKTTTYAILGASNHSEKEREKNDFYATNPESLEIFLKALDRDNIKLHNDIWECACGKGHLSEVLLKKGYGVISTDLIDRGYGQTGEKYDFLKINISDNKTDILTNPPYKYAKEFVEHSLEILQDGYYSIMFLKIQFLEGKERRKLFDKYPPKYIYVNSSRQLCLLNGDDTNKISSAVCYCWFIWEKGYKGDPIIRWI